MSQVSSTIPIVCSTQLMCSIQLVPSTTHALYNTSAKVRRGASETL
ncbi:hypothetical protein LCGC14_1636890 [marine sediment metagenome]|uniref:Uncharacterized protein n=1 Tax=marine sediment metagenome TaxID=412755 RepID=A0A0F9L0G4_9ZZZZ